jgi:DNA-binding NarL/FixJ family response regulator
MPMRTVTPTPVPVAPVQSSKGRIYIVDDHALIRRGLAAMINAEADLEVCGEAEDCATATSEVSRLLPDMVVVDISLRGNNGIELIKNIKAFDSRILMLVLSMHDESVYALRVLKAGARGYVAKKDVATKILDAIRRIRRGQMYVSDCVSSQMLNRIVRGQEAEVESPVAGLSDRELEVVTLIGGGLGTREIATRLHVSVKTVETHRSHIKTKLNLRTAIQLVQFCFQWVHEGKRETV